MTLYDLLPFLAEYQSGLAAAAFIIAVAIGRTTQQWLYYRKKQARDLWFGLRQPNKHQADTITDTSIVILAVLGGVALETVAVLSIGLWSIVQIGLHRGLGHDDLHEGEARTWDLDVFGRTFHLPKFRGREGRYAIIATILLTALVSYFKPLCLLTGFCEL